MTKLMMCLLAMLTVSCASPVYQSQNWAKVSFEQAKAECLNDVQANPLRGYPRCLEAKGWKIVGYE
jgi:hypothetical protein